MPSQYVHLCKEGKFSMAVKRGRSIQRIYRVLHVEALHRNVERVYITLGLLKRVITYIVS